MKTNGYLLLGLVSFWLVTINPALSQDSQREVPKNRREVIPSQIDKNPVDLINPHTIRTSQFRNAIKSSSDFVEYQPDSILYYAEMALKFRETFTYDLNGNITAYHSETKGNFGWQNTALNTFSYDDYGHVLTELKQTWVNFFWEKTYLLTYTYDDDGNMLTYLLQNWEYGHWNNYNFIQYTYDKKGKLLTSLVQNWNIEEWSNSSLSTNRYDAKGYLDYSIRQNWIDGNWENSIRNYNTYNAEGYILASYSEFWWNNEWISDRLLTYTYDDSGNNETFFEQFWGNGEWLNQTMILRGFDGNGNKLSELSQEWLDTWNNISNSIFTYDENGNCTSRMCFIWNNDSWENYFKVEYGYMEGLIRGIGYIWDESGWVQGDAMLDMMMINEGELQFFCEWWGTMAEVYYSSIFTNAPEQPDVSSDLIIYPNPASDRLNISFVCQESENTTINIFDLSGKMIVSNPLGNISNGLKSIELNTSNLTPGIYIFELTSGQKSSIKKVTILK